MSEPIPTAKTTRPPRVSGSDGPAKGDAQRERACQPVTAARLESMLSGHGLTIAGVLLLLVGCAYFLDLSFARGWIGPAERVALGTLTGSALLVAATRFLRGAYRMLAQGVAGLGAGIVYLSSWTAMALYPDLHVPRVAAFALMFAVTVVLAVIADRERCQALAWFGLVGAYLTPILLADETPDRNGLAAYLLIVTAGLLLLARRRAFVALELATVALTLLYAPLLAPNARLGWTDNAAATVSTLFFIVFAVACTLRPIVRRAERTRTLSLVVAATLYVGSLEAIFAAQQTMLGTALIAFAVTLALATKVPRFPRELQPAYRFLALFAGNLALRAFFDGTSLFGGLAVEAALLVAFGLRTNDALIARFGIALSALAACGLLWQALTLAPAARTITPLALGFIVWARSAYTVRRAIPLKYRQPAATLAHAVALVGLTRGVLDALGGSSWHAPALPNVALVVISIGWALFAAALFARGISACVPASRWEGLALFALTLLKVFAVDSAHLDLAFRIAAFLGTGFILVLSSACYTRATRVRTVLGPSDQSLQRFALPERVIVDELHREPGDKSGRIAVPHAG